MVPVFRKDTLYFLEKDAFVIKVCNLCCNDLIAWNPADPASTVTVSVPVWDQSIQLSVTRSRNNYEMQDVVSLVCGNPLFQAFRQ